jgi:hypothetical protein
MIRIEFIETGEETLTEPQSRDIVRPSTQSSTTSTSSAHPHILEAVPSLWFNTGPAINRLKIVSTP